jgi:hypothetical protein
MLTRLAFFVDHLQRLGRRRFGFESLFHANNFTTAQPERDNPFRGHGKYGFGPGFAHQAVECAALPSCCTTAFAFDFGAALDEFACVHGLRFGAVFRRISGSAAGPRFSTRRMGQSADQ